MNKGVLIGLSMMLSQGNATQAAVDGCKIQDNEAHLELFDVLSENNNEKNTYQFSTKDMEILKGDINKMIIEGAVYYFEHDVNFSVSKDEMEKLKKDLEKYLLKNPNIISLNGNKVKWDMNRSQFKDLFKILVEYFRKGDALKNHKLATPGMILRHIEDRAKSEEAEFYYFYYFGRFFMEIVKQLNGSMTIGEYIMKMVDILPNEHISKNIESKKYKDIRYLDVRELDSPNLKKRFMKK